MLLRTLDYEEQFRCLAGRCPHSCCVGWEVMLDEDHARRYLAGDDPLSRRAAEFLELTFKLDINGLSLL